MPKAPPIRPIRRSGRENAPGIRCSLDRILGGAMTKRKGKPGFRAPGGTAGRPGKRAGKRAGSPPRPGSRPFSRGPAARQDTALWLYGVHAVLAALANPARRPERLLASPEAAQAWGQRLRDERHPAHAALGLETVQRHDIDALLPEGSVHPGLALRHRKSGG